MEKVLDDRENILDRLQIETIEGVPLGHISDLLAAEKDGRLVVLPCKVGDTVFAIERGLVKEFTVSFILSDNEGNICMQAECKEQGEQCRLCSEDSYCGFRFSAENMTRRKIFLTREAAEKALKEGAE